MNKKLEIYYSGDSVINVYAKEKKHLKDNYARCFLNEITNVASNKDLNGTDLRVLLGIIGHLEYENLLNISQKKLGEILKIPRQEITKSINKLISKNYLQIVDKIGRQNIYKLNPRIAFKSRAKNHKNLCNDWEENTTSKKIDLDINLNLDSNLDKNLETKFKEKIDEISKKFNVEKNKAKEIMLFLINQGLNKNNTKDNDLPY